MQIAALPTEIRQHDFDHARVDRFDRLVVKINCGDAVERRNVTHHEIAAVIGSQRLGFVAAL